MSARHIAAFSTFAVAVPLALSGPAAVAAPQWPAAKSPKIKVALNYKTVGKKVTMTIALNGRVYEPLDEDDQPIDFDSPATIDIGLGQSWTWGDKSLEEGTDGGAVHCGKPHVLRKVKDDFVVTKKYSKPGTYTFSYTFYACGLKGERITATVPITVP